MVASAQIAKTTYIITGHAWLSGDTSGDEDDLTDAQNEQCDREADYCED